MYGSALEGGASGPPAGAGIVVEQLVYAHQCLADGELTALLNEHFAVVTREVFEGFAAFDDLQIGGGQTFLLMLCEKVLDSPHVIHNLAAAIAPN